MRFLRLFHPGRPAESLTLTTQPKLVDLLIAAELAEPGLSLVQKQLEIDIDAKARGWSPIPFTLLELIEIDRLVTRHGASKLPIRPGDTVIFRQSERKLVASYVARYRQRAKESEAAVQFAAYEQLMASLLECSIRLPVRV